MAGEFCIGDRVIYTNPRWVGNPNIKRTDIGTVCEILGAINYGVDWGHNIGGHDCSGNCPDGHGWRVSGRYLKLAEPDISFDVSSSDIDSLFLEVV